MPVLHLFRTDPLERNHTISPYPVCAPPRSLMANSSFHAWQTHLTVCCLFRGQNSKTTPAPGSRAGVVFGLPFLAVDRPLHGRGPLLGVGAEALVVTGEDRGLDAEVVGDLLAGLMRELAAGRLADRDDDLGVGRLQRLVVRHVPGPLLEDAAAEERLGVLAHALEAFHLLRRHL